jgi:4'-phosphopantetheinyl transferase EntD
VIDEILPAEVRSASMREDTEEIDLFPGEQAAIAQAVDRRRREFVTGRACARRALQRLGYPPAPILPGPKRQPLWPTGVVGSLTHCDGYRAAAVARDDAFLTVGIDAEPHAALPRGVDKTVMLPSEQAALADLATRRPAIHWDRLLFSAKESVYKAWFPLAQRWLGFHDAELRFSATNGTFSAQLLVDGPVIGDRALRGFEGRWLVRDGLLVTAIVMEVPGGADGPPAPGSV